MGLITASAAVIALHMLYNSVMLLLVRSVARRRILAKAK
jgi:hypothetical protein